MIRITQMPGVSFRPPHLPQVGRGVANAHLGELLQGMFENGHPGSLYRGLVTLPCNLFQARANFEPGLSQGYLTVDPCTKTKARAAAECALEYLGYPDWSGHLALSDSFPEASQGWGLGSSTADVTAAIRAVANAFDRTLPAAIIARLAVEAEEAADSLAFGEHGVLFAQRDGFVLEDFGDDLPSVEIVGFNTDPRGLDTLAFPPADYHRHEIERFRNLRSALRRAVTTQDPHLLGQVAMASARINQRFLPTRGFAELEKIARGLGATGLAVSHSGTVVGVLFDALDPKRNHRLERAMRIVETLGFQPWRFGVNTTRKPRKTVASPA